MTKLLFTLILGTALISACSGNIFSVHKIDIEQGNLLNAAAIDEVSAGMTRKQVVALLGEPVLQPILNPDRWEYVFYRKRADQPVEKELVTVHFSNDKVTDIKHDR
jgi:outer membrane protein assembly factor BamE